MKNFSLLALVILLGLPGCCGNKKKTVKQDNSSRIEENVDMFSSVDMDDSLDDFDAEDDNIRTFFNFDDETEEFIPADENTMYSSFDTDVEDLDNQAYSWIDMQTDDELKPLYFAFNHYGLNEEQKNTVAYDIEQLKQLIADSGSDAQPTIVVEGHACQEGAPAYNIALSEKRAKTVADMLVDAGIDKDTIKVVGRGQEVPAVINGHIVDGSREQRAPNRRVELRVIYT